MRNKVAFQKKGSNFSTVFIKRMWGEINCFYSRMHSPTHLSERKKYDARTKKNLWGFEASVSQTRFQVMTNENKLKHFTDGVEFTRHVYEVFGRVNERPHVELSYLYVTVSWAIKRIREGLASSSLVSNRKFKEPQLLSDSKC